MGHTLKLDIYCFELKEILELCEKIVKGGEKRKYHKTKDSIAKFSDVFSQIYSDKKREEYFKLFLQEFISSFNNAFTSNKSNTQAISITDNLYKSISSYNNVFSGEFIGGQTGIDVDIYKTDNARTKKNTLDKDSVASLSYYYKIWLPLDSNTGIIMIQSYTTFSCNTLFKEKLENLFESKGYALRIAKIVPEQYIKEYMNFGYIYKILVLTKQKTTHSLKPNFTPFKKAKRRMLIDKISIPFRELFSRKDYIHAITSDIKQLYDEFDEKNDELILYYKDENGRKAHSKLCNIESMLPNYVLDDSLKNPETQKPIFEELDKFTNGLLEKLKKEIGYTPIINENI